MGDSLEMVTTISYEDLSAVVSKPPPSKEMKSKKYFITHEEVITRVMRDYNVLPVKLYTVADSASMVCDFLETSYTRLKSMLEEMQSREELEVKAFWSDMKPIFGEIFDEHREIERKNKRVESQPLEKTYQQRLEIGEMMHKALELKRKREREDLLKYLKGSCVDYRANRIYSESMILNGAFLVEKAQKPEFDAKVDMLSMHYKQRMRFKYMGPIPPFDFIQVRPRWKK